MSLDSLLTDEQSVQLIKTYDTLHIDSIANNPNETCIYDYFLKKIKERFILKKDNDEIGLIISRGFSFYSSKYDLYVGNGGIIRCRDIYFVGNN